jgi:hypothetical protein
MSFGCLSKKPLVRVSVPLDARPASLREAEMITEDDSERFRTVVGTAFRNGELINAPADDPRVAAIVNECDWTLAVWPDSSDELLDGFKLLSVRGHEKATGGGMRTNAIPRVDMESALALQALYGSPSDIAGNRFIVGLPTPRRPQLVARDGVILSS